MPGRGAWWPPGLLALMMIFPPLVSRGDDRVTTVPNRTVQLPCGFPFIQGAEDLSVAWYKEQHNGSLLLVHKFIRGKEDLSEQDPLYRGRTQLSEGISQGNLTLALTEVTQADQGTYLCKGANSKAFETKKVELYISDPVTKPTIDVVYIEEGGVLLHCASSTPHVTYKWLAEDGETVTKQQVYTIERPREDLTLTCVVGDGVSEDRESITIPHNRESSRSHRLAIIAVAVVGGIFISLLLSLWRKTSDDREWVTAAQKPSSLHRSVGQKAKISCRIRKTLGHKWKFYSSKFKKVEKSERVTFTPNSLIIGSVTPADAGLYIYSGKDERGVRYRGSGTNLTVTATPTLTVTENLVEALLTCKAEKFYPEDLEIFWSIHPKVQIAEDLTDNKDGTFNKLSRLKLTGVVPEEDCACHVRHCTLRATMYRPENIESEGCGRITFFLTCREAIQSIEVEKDGELFIKLVMDDISEVLGNRFILERRTLTIKEVKPPDHGVYVTEVHQPDGSVRSYHFRVIENREGVRETPAPEGRLDEVVDVSPDCSLVKLSIPAREDGKTIVWKKGKQTLMTCIVHSDDHLVNKLVVKPWSVTVNNPEEGCSSYKVDIHLAEGDKVSNIFNLQVKKPENNSQDNKTLRFKVERRIVTCELLGEDDDDGEELDEISYNPDLNSCHPVV